VVLFVCRFVDQQPEDWTVAEDACIKQGARLVAIDTKLEKDFVAKR
jgi:hypothetical protein